MRRAVAFATAAFAAAGCADTALEAIPEPPAARPDILMSVAGRVCTRDPEEIRFPVRVAFIVDTSQSMTVSDPRDPLTGETGRQRAVRETVEALGFSQEIAYAVISFGGSPTVTTQFDDDGDGDPDTDGYSSDPSEVAGAIADLSLDATTTNYVGALATAFELAFADVLRQPPDEVARAKYVFVFLSDGLPDSDDPKGGEAEEQEEDDILNAVADIADLEAQLSVGEVAFHTAYLATNATPAIEQVASALLRDMAEVGGGTFRSFPNGEAIDFLTIDYTSIRRVFALTDLVVTNVNALPIAGASDANGDGLPDGEPSFVPEPDSDGDGLPDAIDAAFGSVFEPDADGDFFSDLLEWRLSQSGGAFDARDAADGQCPSEVDQRDLDADGLRDCEELYFGSNPRFFDSDLDGLPDPVEVVFGTDAAIDDADDDLDVDGGDNGAEVRAHTDPLVYDAADRARRSYLYRLEQQPVMGATTCADFTVSGIALAPTADGWAEIRLYASERPFDRPDSFALWRVACARALWIEADQAKVPASGRILLPEGAFVPVEDFDAARDCLEPEE